MTSTDKAEISFANLSLEPIDGEPLKVPPTPQVLPHANARSKTKTDRRVLAERRKVIRFEDDRRSGKNRRPKKSWELGNNR